MGPGRAVPLGRLGAPGNRSCSLSRPAMLAQPAPSRRCPEPPGAAGAGRCRPPALPRRRRAVRGVRGPPGLPGGGKGGERAGVRPRSGGAGARPCYGGADAAAGKRRGCPARSELGEAAAGLALRRCCHGRRASSMASFGVSGVWEGILNVKVEHRTRGEGLMFTRVRNRVYSHSSLPSIAIIDFI